MDSERLQMTLGAASAAVSHAQDVRATYRKRAGRGDQQRQRDIEFALTRLKRVMEPIRSELARIPYELRLLEQVPSESMSPPELWDQRRVLLEASEAMQRERRKLWKMKEHKGGTRGKR